MQVCQLASCKLGWLGKQSLQAKCTTAKLGIPSETPSCNRESILTSSLHHLLFAFELISTSYICEAGCMLTFVLLEPSSDPNLKRFHTCSQRLHDKHWQRGSNYTSHLESRSPKWRDKTRLLQKIGPHCNSSQEHALQPVLTLHPQKVLNWIIRSIQKLALRELWL